MINVMRKHHKVLMIFITALVCISFSWYWNKTDFSSINDRAAGKFYDREVSQAELQRNTRLLRLASQLGMRDLVGPLTIGAETESDALQNFAWNLMVLRHEANRLGITATTAEIADAVKALPAFKGEKGFDLAAYTAFVDRALAPMGFTEAQIEELAGDQIALERVKKILSAGVSVPESEMRHDFEEAYARMDVAIIRFQEEDFSKDLQVSDDQVAKYFEANKADLKTDEKRKVKFVQFGLTDEQKKLTGKARIEVLQKLADKATDFTDALQAKGADFDQVAAKFQLPIKETNEFAKATPDPLLAGTPQLAQAAFSLTNDSPNSDAIQTKEGFNILHLTKIEPARPLTQDEARPKIVEAVSKQQVRQVISAKAAEVASQLRENLKNGKPVEQGASGMKVEKLPPFALVDTPPGASPTPSAEPKNEPKDMQVIKQAASRLSAGEVSDYLNTPQGGLIVVLEKREQLGPAEFEKARAFFETRALTNKGQIVFYEWLRDRRHAAGIQEKKAEPAAG